MRNSLFNMLQKYCCPVILEIIVNYLFFLNNAFIYKYLYELQNI